MTRAARRNLREHLLSDLPTGGSACKTVKLHLPPIRVQEFDSKSGFQYNRYIMGRVCAGGKIAGMHGL